METTPLQRGTASEADMTIRNRHPVDRLAELRAEIKTLQDEADEIRDGLLAEGADLSGVEHYARVTTSETRRLDRKALEAKFGKAAVDKCTVSTSTTTVRLVARYGDMADAAE